MAHYRFDSQSEAPSQYQASYVPIRRNIALSGVDLIFFTVTDGNREHKKSRLVSCEEDEARGASTACQGARLRCKG
eukprot:7051047-Pyramimonas_sp.AAC.2